jgi:hypothetical protein
VPIARAFRISRNRHAPNQQRRLGPIMGRTRPVIYPQAPSRLLNSKKRAMFAVYSFGRRSRRGRGEVDEDPPAAPGLANAMTMPRHTRRRLGLAY